MSISFRSPHPNDMDMVQYWLGNEMSRQWIGAYGPSWNPVTVHQRPGNHILLAEQDEQPFGFLHFVADEDRPWVGSMSVCVAPEARGHGLAQQMICAAMLLPLPYEQIIAYVDPQHPCSHHMLQQCGFVDGGYDADGEMLTLEYLHRSDTLFC